MIDETKIGETNQPEAVGPEPSPASANDPVVAYCQQCGRALTATSQRRVGTGIFCEPCATVRRAQAPGWSPVNPGSAPTHDGAPNTGTNGEPNPALAGFLGLIPGVGAMANGQYAKGVIHLIVFVVLVSLADNLSWVLWWLVWGWIFYQAFEAYHTAQARRDGQPLPDPFGWNELGERLGFARSWPAPTNAGPRTPPPVPPNHGFAAEQTVRPPQNTGPMATEPFYPAPPPYTAPTPPPFGASPYEQVPFTPTFSGNPPQPAAQPEVVIGSRRFPLGAVWLIGLGLLFLLGNLLPTWHIEGRWLVPILLAAVALWMGGNRLTTLHASGAQASTAGGQSALADSLMAPVLLLTVAALLALQDASVIPFRRSWPALLIVWGLLLMLQRAGVPAATPLPPAANATGTRTADNAPRRSI